jgi:putative regulator of septum formation
MVTCRRFHSGWWASLVAVGVFGLAAACGGLPDGVDGELVDGWAPMHEPVQVVPEAGVCHDYAYSETPRLVGHEQVTCTESHFLETVHVGTFEGETAERNSAPSPGAAGWRTAYRECDEQATEYLGADFRYGRLWLGVAVPTDAAWRAGARWFRCDIERLNTFDNLVDATDSLRDVFDGDAELALGCFTGRSEEVEESDFFSIEQMEAVSCDEPHRAEFVGVWHADDDARFPRTDTAKRRISDGCLERIAAYLDTPVSVDLLLHTGIAWLGMSELDWDNGNHGFRCFLWVDDDRLTASLEGAGIDALRA